MSAVELLRFGAYESHPLHGADRTWTETNCYVDLWIELLPERHRVVLAGYFMHGRKSQDIADELGVTESRISQLRS